MTRGGSPVESFWTPERLAELAKLAGEGHSASVIGSRIGATRSAIIGKAHRLNITLNGKRIGGGPHARLSPRDRPPPSKSKKPPAPREKKVAPRRESPPPPPIKPRGNWATYGRRGDVKIACMWPGCGGPVGVDARTREADGYCAQHIADARARGMVRRSG